MKELSFAMNWNAQCDEEKWNILLKESKERNLYVLLDYDTVIVKSKDDEDMNLIFNETEGCISGIYVMLRRLGVPVEYAE